MTRDAERAYVQRWVETGQMLEDFRWRELRTLDAATALRASNDLIDAALRVPFPAARRRWSGLVELQDVLRTLRPQVNGLFAAAADILAFCAARGWRCCVIGGVAVQRWGEPRQTRDVDGHAQIAGALRETPAVN